MRRAFLLFIFTIFTSHGYGQTTGTETAVVSRRPGPIFFKRAELTAEQIAMIEEEREINNLNIMLRRPVNGEELALGTIGDIECVDGRIYFKLKGAKELRLTAERFGDIDFSVLTPGTRAFTFRCGGRFPEERFVAIYRRGAERPGVDGTVASLTFVPPHFRVKSLDTIAREPMIVIVGLDQTDVEANIRAAEAERAEMERVTREAREQDVKNAAEADGPASDDPGGEGGPLSLRRITDLVGTGLRADAHVEADRVAFEIRGHRDINAE